MKLGERLANQHDDYRKFMKRIQKMIATITIAEKEERCKETKIE